MAAVIKEAKAAANAASKDAERGWETSLMDELKLTSESAGTNDAAVPVDVERLVLDQISKKDLISKSESQAELQKAQRLLSKELAAQIADIHTKLAQTIEESVLLANRVSQLAERNAGETETERHAQRERDADSIGDADTASASSGGRISSGGAEGASGVDTVAGSATSKLKSLRRKK
eukprot:COSAG03_NODE_381_length_8359_cov_16.596126_4_plen_178_part_00